MSPNAISRAWARPPLRVPLQGISSLGAGKLEKFRSGSSSAKKFDRLIRDRIVRPIQVIKQAVGQASRRKGARFEHVNQPAVVEEFGAHHLLRARPGARNHERFPVQMQNLGKRVVARHRDHHNIRGDACMPQIERSCAVSPLPSPPLRGGWRRRRRRGSRGSAACRRRSSRARRRPSSPLGGTRSQ